MHNNVSDYRKTSSLRATTHRQSPYKQVSVADILQCFTRYTIVDCLFIIIQCFGHGEPFGVRVQRALNWAFLLEYRRTIKARMIWRSNEPCNTMTIWISETNFAYVPSSGPLSLSNHQRASVRRSWRWVWSGHCVRSWLTTISHHLGTAIF